jgi:protein-S-isoprenylcysteine O-methyltransferase Ste14
MKSLLSLVYGLFAYVTFLGAFGYAMGFVGNVGVPKSIDSGAQGTLSEALIVNVLLLAVFAVQHSVMARKGWKRVWTRVVPPALERSTFVLFASLSLILLYWQWRPMTQPVWTATDAATIAICSAVFGLGWMLVLVSTFLINHFELFGLHQVLDNFRGRSSLEPQFKTPGLYRYVRHPIYLGFVLAFWATPEMTLGHLLFGAATTGYILLGIWFEERDLIERFGQRYEQYRKQVGMLWPWRGRDAVANELISSRERIASNN